MGSSTSASIVVASFSFDTKANVDEVGEVPGGRRLHLAYEAVDITPAAGSSFARGRLLSGTDWILVREDKVVVFDALLTFRADESADGKPFAFVFGCAVSGRAHAPSGPAAISVALPAAFEAAELSEGWIADKYKVPKAVFDKYRALVERQCLAVGTVEIPGNGAARVQLAFHQLELKTTTAGG